WLHLALGRYDEVIGDGSERLEVAFRPLVVRLQDHRVAFAVDKHRAGLEPELLRQSDCLTPACRKDLRLGVFHGISDGTSQRYIPCPRRSRRATARSSLRIRTLQAESRRVVDDLGNGRDAELRADARDVRAD